MKRAKTSNISQNVIRRMPRYLRRLDELSERGIERVSSKELGEQLGLTPSQIRQDFSCFGEFGQQGYGYNVPVLRAHIASILGIDRGFTAILVGVGNIAPLGTAVGALASMLVAVLVIDDALLLRLTLMTAGLVLIRHIPAIVRIFRRTEPRLSFEKDITYKLDQ